MKSSNRENLNESLNSKIKQSIRNANHSNVKQIANVNRKLESVEYLIKIEEKNKRQLEDKYEKKISKIEKSIEKFENELELTLKELNEKEAKIFDIQKNKLQLFRYEIQKYEDVFKDMEEKFNEMSEYLNNINNQEMNSYNTTYMVYEDYLSYNNEIILSKKKLIDLKETLTQIEKSYPQDFQFLLEDVQFEKELKEISFRRKKLYEEIDILEKNKKDIFKSKELKQFELKSCLNEIRKVELNIENNIKDNHLKNMEEYIIKHISDLLIFEKMKLIIQNFYSQKNFDLENEVNVILIKNLTEKMKEMKNEFMQIKNDKLMYKIKLEKIINDLTHGQNNPTELKNRSVELEKLINEINMLELNCKKKETLLNKYIIVLRNKCTKSSQESYYELNPALIIETEFEEKFKEEIFKQIDNENIPNEEKMKNKNMIELYVKEIMNREKILQSFYQQRKKLEESFENINKEIERLDEKLIRLENEIIAKKSNLSDILLKEKFIQEKLHIRNKNLTSNLEQLGELEFEKYIKSNDNILKNMKKIYGNKVIDKVFKSQKQKFLENIVLDHTFKKGKVCEYIQAIAQYERNLELYNSNIIELENNYTISFEKLQSIIDYKNQKQKEHNILKESKDDLKEKIEMILKKQMEELDIEKKQLHYKFNVNYYIEKIKELNDKIEELNIERDTFLKEYHNFRDVLDEKEQKLYLEDLDLKNNLISLTMCVDDKNSNTHIPFKVNNIKSDNITNSFDNVEAVKDDQLFSDVLKRSTIEYKNKTVDPSREIMEDIVKNEEDMKSSGGSYMVLYQQMKKDNALYLAVNKIKPFNIGLNIYKKFNNSLNSKIFDPKNAKDFPPESCGYAIRLFKINSQEETLDIKNIKNKHCETKINLQSIKSILLSNVAKNIIKNRKSTSMKPNLDLNMLINTDYIPFSLILDEGSLDLISPSYNLFITIENAIEEIVKNKKNLYGILKLIEK